MQLINHKMFLFSARYINGQYRKLNLNPLGGVIPFKLELVALVLAFVVTAISSVFNSKFNHSISRGIFHVI